MGIADFITPYAVRPDPNGGVSNGIRGLGQLQQAQEFARRQAEVERHQAAARAEAEAKFHEDSLRYRAEFGTGAREAVNRDGTLAGVYDPSLRMLGLEGGLESVLVPQDPQGQPGSGNLTPADLSASGSSWMLEAARQAGEADGRATAGLSVPGASQVGDAARSMAAPSGQDAADVALGANIDSRVGSILDALGAPKGEGRRNNTPEEALADEVETIRRREEETDRERAARSEFDASAQRAARAEAGLPPMSSYTLSDVKREYADLARGDAKGSRPVAPIATPKGSAPDVPGAPEASAPSLAPAAPAPAPQDPGYRLGRGELVNQERLAKMALGWGRNLGQVFDKEDAGWAAEAVGEAVEAIRSGAIRTEKELHEYIKSREDVLLRKRDQDTAVDVARNRPPPRGPAGPNPRTEFDAGARQARNVFVSNPHVAKQWAEHRDIKRILHLADSNPSALTDAMIQRGFAKGLNGPGVLTDRDAKAPTAYMSAPDKTWAWLKQNTVGGLTAEARQMMLDTLRSASDRIDQEKRDAYQSQLSMAEAAGGQSDSYRSGFVGDTDRIFADNEFYNRDELRAAAGMGSVGPAPRAGGGESPGGEAPRQGGGVPSGRARALADKYRKRAP